MQRSPQLDLLKFFIATSAEVTSYYGTATSLRLSILLHRAGPLGLLGNLGSVISIADPWRDDGAGHTTPDLWWILLLNAFALTLGVCANVLLAFRPHMLILVSALYVAACLVYVALLASTQYVYFNGHGYERTAGFWQGVCAAALYIVAGALSGLHAAYYKRKRLVHKLKPPFRRMEVLFAVYLAYIAVAGAAFHAPTMLNCSFSEGVYFTIVTCLTLGYGDVVPTKTLPRALDIPMVYIGLILGGIVTVAIFDESISDVRSATVFDRVDRARRSADARIHDPEDAFETMQHIVDHCATRGKFITAALTVSWLAVFWLIGALVYHYTEGWTYFQAVYSSAISLASVGYGDFVPKSPGGRAFFIHWALIAVPTVATTVSDVYTLIMAISRRLKRPRTQRVVCDSDEDLEYYLTGDRQQDEWRMLNMISEADSHATFSYKVWNTIVTDLVAPETLPDNFWLSEISPIRNPTLNERTFLLLACAHVLEKVQE